MGHSSGLLNLPSLPLPGLGRINFSLVRDLLDHWGSALVE